MSERLTVTGMVLKAYDYSEYDRRLIVLAREVGRITVFAKGVRRQGAKFMAASEPFVYGDFRLFEGKNAYNLSEAEVKNYFENIRLDMERMLYASFFADMTEYCTRENVDGSENLKLLYRALQALLTDNLDKRLISAAFQLKLIMLGGEYAGAENEKTENNGTMQTIKYIEKSDIKDLFSFRVSDEVKEELTDIAEKRRTIFIPTKLKSLEVMKDLGYN